MKIVKNIAGTTQHMMAILCADIFEYSKHTSEDQAGTHKVVRDRFELIEKVIDKNDGNIIRMQGDGILVAFSNVRNAIYCATEIQISSHQHNFKLSLNYELLFRVGISFGQVILEDNEPFGNAVNTAKRLEELAKPGGIYISSDTYEALDTALPFPINFRGKVRMKNAEEPIIVYEVSQYEPLSIKNSSNNLLKHPIDRSYLGSLSILILAISVIVLAISVVVLVSTLSIL